MESYGIDLDFNLSINDKLPPINEYKDLISSLNNPTVFTPERKEKSQLSNKEENIVENTPNTLRRKSAFKSIKLVKGKSLLSSVNFKNKSQEMNESTIKRKPINILYMIKCVSVAIKKLRNRTIFKSIKYLLNEEFNLIDDKTYFCEINEKNNDEIKLLLSKGFLRKMVYRFKIFFKKIKIFNFFMNKIKNLYLEFLKLHVISPQNKFKIIWDLFMTLIMIICFLMFPLQMSFNIIFIDYYFGNSIENLIINKVTFILAIFLFDLLVKFITGFYKDGVLVLDMKSSIKNYIKTSFLYDFISIIPVILNFMLIVFFEKMESYHDWIKFSGLFFFFRFFEFSKIIKSFEELFHLTEKGEAYFKLFKLLTTLIFIIHLLACLWNAIAYYSPYEKTILRLDDNASLNQKFWYNDYISCIYWSISYGKVNPQNPLEKAFGTFAVFIYQITSAFIIGGILNIVKILSHKENEKKENIRAVNDFMREKNIEYDLQIKVRKYLNFIYEKTDNTEKGKEIINKLSNSLKEEVIIRANGTILKDTPLFAKNFSEESLRKTVFLMKNIKFYPGEVIYEKNGTDNFLYLILDGEINISLDSMNEKHQIKKLKKGDIFGEYSFFTDNNRLCTAISSTFTTVFAISREDFISKIKENQLDYEKFLMIRDRMLIYNSYHEDSTKCFSCRKKDHSLFECPALHFIPDSHFLISRYLHSEPHLQRVAMKRKRKKVYNALLIKQNIEIAIKALISDTLLIDESDSIEDYDLNKSYDSQKSLIEGKTIESESNLNENLDMNNETKELKKNNNFKKSVSFNDNINIEINTNSLKRINSRKETSNNIIEIKQDENQLIIEDSNKDYKEIEIINKKKKTPNINDNTILEKNNDLFFKEFDSMKNFKVYFSSNNADKIIEDQKNKNSRSKSPRKSTKSRSWKKKKNNLKEFSNLGLKIKIMKNDNLSENHNLDSCNSPTFSNKKKFFITD